MGFNYISDDDTYATLWHDGALWKNAPLSKNICEQARHLGDRLRAFRCQVPPALDGCGILEHAVLVLLGFLAHTAAGNLLRGPFLARGLQLGGDIITYEAHVWCTTSRPERHPLMLEDGPEELMELIENYLDAREPDIAAGATRPQMNKSVN